MSAARAPFQGSRIKLVFFLVFEPDGLVHRWRRIKAYWKLYPFSY